MPFILAPRLQMILDAKDEQPKLIGSEIPDIRTKMSLCRQNYKYSHNSSCIMWSNSNQWVELLSSSGYFDSLQVPLPWTTAKGALRTRWRRCRNLMNVSKAHLNKISENGCESAEKLAYLTIGEDSKSKNTHTVTTQRPCLRGICWCIRLSTYTTTPLVSCLEESLPLVNL